MKIIRVKKLILKFNAQYAYTYTHANTYTQTIECPSIIIQLAKKNKKLCKVFLNYQEVFNCTS